MSTINTTIKNTTIKFFLFPVALFAMSMGCTSMADSSKDSEDSANVAPDWATTLTASEANNVKPTAVFSDTSGDTIVWRLPVGAVSGSDYVVEKWNEEDSEWDSVSHVVKMDTATNDEVSYVEEEFVSSVDKDTDSSIVTDYRVVSTDENGEESSTQVTAVNYPAGAILTVTLSDECEALAESGVDAQYNGGMQNLWPIQRLSALDLPQSIVLNAPIDANSPVYLVVTTLMPDSEESEIVRASNSSFCRVEEVTPLSADVVARLKFSFEDLPLSAVVREPSGAFDYNDVILYVDVVLP
ncbi:MAG: hypothetical protein JXR76_24595 [Deltaproteobacteria bacterium]|nr:hypothetical protein [Deltaproteobacteria bacterium]